MGVPSDPICLSLSFSLLPVSNSVLVFLLVWPDRPLENADPSCRLTLYSVNFQFENKGKSLLCNGHFSRARTGDRDRSSIFRKIKQA